MLKAKVLVRGGTPPPPPPARKLTTIFMNDNDSDLTSKRQNVLLGAMQLSIKFPGTENATKKCFSLGPCVSADHVFESSIRHRIV